MVATILLFGLLSLITTAYLLKARLYHRQKVDDYEDLKRVDGFRSTDSARHIVDKLNETGKDCVIFFGSQTGTAQDFAGRLAKEADARFGLQALVADLEDYEPKSLLDLPAGKVAIFILATYGEGEPTDNAVEFWNWVTDDGLAHYKEQGLPLSNMRYAMFGLGNSSYEHYNSVVRKVGSSLESLGGKRLCEIGEGDDGNKTAEEDFLVWRETMWASVAAFMNLQEHKTGYKATFNVREVANAEAASNVYLGELHETQLLGGGNGPVGPHNPCIVPVIESRELFRVKDRNCLHMELDIGNSAASYKTGDHLAVWPMNPDEEVGRFLKVFGLADKRHVIIDIMPIDSSEKVPLPSPTTFDAMARYYLEICGPVSRDLVARLAEFSPTQAVREEMARLGSSREWFSQTVSSCYLTLGQLLEKQSPHQPFSSVPISILVESIRRLQPRYYSISSSPLVHKGRVSITAVVKSLQISSEPRLLKGVATNYLLALKQQRDSEDLADKTQSINYQVDGPRGKYHSRLPVYIRSSNFTLPSDDRLPIVMVGPGTGVAPFRGFIQERVCRKKGGFDIGQSLLFFGCRRVSDDFIYEEEWQEYQQVLGDKFELVTAFSRDGPSKTYVQDRLQERAEQVYNLLLQQGGRFYVCGDAKNMSREVHETLVNIIAACKKVSVAQSHEMVKAMRASGQYQEDVWA